MTHLKPGWYLQVWMYGAPYAAEKDLNEAIELALKYGAVGIAPKVMDGTTWMGSVNPGHAAPMGVSTVSLDHEKCTNAGLDYLPWVNPLYGDDNFLRTQAKLYAQIGKAAGKLMWDSEPYAGFWGANKPVGAAAFLLAAFREQAPDCVNVWQPDPRPGRLAELRPAEWSSRMDVYSPQAYWSDFETTPQIEVDNAAFYAKGLGLECAPTIPANTDASTYGPALTRMADHGIVTTIAWRMGTLGVSHLQALQELTKQDPPPADNTLKDLSDELGLYVSEINDLQQRLAKLSVTA